MILPITSGSPPQLATTPKVEAPLQVQVAPALQGGVAPVLPPARTGADRAVKAPTGAYPSKG